MHDLGFPLGVRLTHWFNFLFLSLLVRSGIAILAAHPKLYWNSDCLPGTEWLRFTRLNMPKDQLWASKDEEEDYPAWLSLPGGISHNTLGLGRYWHFTAALGWLVTGVLYLVILFATDQWRRLVPTSWQVFPEAVRDMGMYLTLRTPSPGTSYSPTPFNALQQLTYFLVIFWLAPHMILTGLAMSPLLESRFPWYPRLFFGRQSARSLHFLGMTAFVLFFIIHMVMVVWHGFLREMSHMVLNRDLLGGTDWTGAVIGLGIILAVVLFHVAANAISENAPRLTHRMLSSVYDPVRTALFHRGVSVPNYDNSRISPFFRTNGYPPIAAYPKAQRGDNTYERLYQDQFADYRLEVTGMVENPLSLSLDNLRALPRQEQITLHHCIQGWTAIGQWAGVPMSEILDRCKPLPGARYLIFHSYQFHDSGKRYYEGIDFEMARQPQTILAYEMNGEPLPIQHGAPVRLRVETKLGFKMVKFLRSIEVVDNYRKIGGGMGGVREDEQQYDMGAEI
jgi:methionine sulfoxide reductase catalytic subunit